MAALNIVTTLDFLKIKFMASMEVKSNEKASIFLFRDIPNVLKCILKTWMQSFCMKIFLWFWVSNFCCN